MRIATSMILLAGLVSCTDLHNAGEFKNSKEVYCNKIDTLIKERYYYRASHYRYTIRILSEIEKASGIYGTYSLGFAGMTYCDTFFNNDVRLWCRYFNCGDRELPVAEPFISAECDTTKFRLGE